MAEQRRKSIRFDPDLNATITLQGRVGSGEKAERIGLIRDESGKGCAGVFRKPFPFKVGQRIKAHVGKLEDMVAEIMWTEDLDDMLIKVGMYLE